jgi:uncharacterized membrane protein (UPF0127 family)
MIVTSSAQDAFKVEVADTVWSRARGLMHHSAIDERSGMLFLYKNEEQVSFWMKNISFPPRYSFCKSGRCDYKNL